MTALPDAGMLDLGDQQLDYRFIGPRPEHAPTLVLLHEGLGCVGLWGNFPDRLSAKTGAGVFVYSRAGYGRSSPAAPPWPVTYMHHEAQDVLPRVLDAIGFRNGLLIGHSDGASIAAIYAGSRRDPRVCGVTLIAPHFFTEDVGLAEIAKARAAYNDPKTGLRARLERWHDHVDNAFCGWSGAWLDTEFQAWDITDYLQTIRVPVLVVQGRDDQYGTERQVAAARDNCGSEVTVAMLDGVGHAPHREAPDILLNSIVAFAERALPARSERNALRTS